MNLEGRECTSRLLVMNLMEGRATTGGLQHDSPTLSSCCNNGGFTGGAAREGGGREGDDGRDAAGGEGSGGEDCLQPSDGSSEERRVAPLLSSPTEGLKTHAGSSAVTMPPSPTSTGKPSDNGSSQAGGLEGGW